VRRESLIAQTRRIEPNAGASGCALAAHGIGAISIEASNSARCLGNANVPDPALGGLHGLALC